MGKLSSLLAFGFVLVSLQRCQGHIDITTCHQVENCFQFFENPTCNSDGTRHICLTWEDFAGCEFDGSEHMEGICKMNNFTPTIGVHDGQQICDDAIGGTMYTFGIKSERPDPIGDTNSGDIMVNGYSNNGGKADCQGFKSVCAAGGNNDFSLTFYVTPCPTTTTTTTTTTTPTTTTTTTTMPPGCTCTDWGQWGGCSATCSSSATRNRYRTCSNCPANTPQSETGSCPGVPVNCPINGVWSQWNPWAGCTASCGSGTNTRTRTCTNPPPQFNGLDCPGFPSETIACVLQQCSSGGGGGGGSGGGGGGGGGGGRRGCKKRAKRGRCSNLKGRARKQCIKRECRR